MKKSCLLGVVHAILICLTLPLSYAKAAVLTFDDLVPVITTGEIPTGYGGFIWTNIRYMNAPNILSGLSGYNNGLVSGDYVAYTPQVSVSTIETTGNLFDFNGAYLTGAWNDGLNINIKGYNGATLLYDTTVIVDTDAPTWFQFDYLGINKLELSSFGGVDNPLYSSGGEHYAIENFTYENTVVPIPSALWLFGSGLLGLIGITRRKKAV